MKLLRVNVQGVNLSPFLAKSAAKGVPLAWQGLRERKRVQKPSGKRKDRVRTRYVVHLQRAWSYSKKCSQRSKERGGSKAGWSWPQRWLSCERCWSGHEGRRLTTRFGIERRVKTPFGIQKDQKHGGNFSGEIKDKSMKEEKDNQEREWHDLKSWGP